MTAITRASETRLSAHPAAEPPRGILIFLSMVVPLLPVLWFASSWYHSELELQQRSHVGTDLTHYTAMLVAETSDHFAVLRGLEAAVSLLSSGQGEAFEDALRPAVAIGDLTAILGLAVAPNGVLTYAYPSPPPGLALGDNLLDPVGGAYRADVDRAVRSGDTSLSVLYASDASKRSLLVWRPVYRAGAFWGIVGIEVDVHNVFHVLPAETDNATLEMAVRDSAGTILFGHEAVFASAPVVQEVALPEGHWQLGAVPAGGWNASVAWQERLFQTSSVLVALLGMCLAYLVVNRQALLLATVRERTREIHCVNEALRADIRRRKRIEAEHELLLAELGQRVAERTHHLSVLYDVAAVASSSLDLPTVMESSLDRILTVMGCQVAAVHLQSANYGGEISRAYTRVAAGELHPPDCPALAGTKPDCWIAEHGTPLVVPDTSLDPRTRYTFQTLGPRAHVGVPIRGRQGRVGVLCVFRDRARPFRADEATLLGAIADHLGVAIENTRLYAEAEGKATLEERQRLARELHDSVTQLLYSSVLMAEAARRATANPTRLSDTLAHLGATVQQALKETRLLVYELRPLSLEQDGLIGALERRLDAVERRAGIQADLNAEALPDLDPQIEEALYRIVQEALNNTLKHAEAKTVVVELAAKGNVAYLRVSDNGKGFTVAAGLDQGGLGLGNMRDRATRLGGSFAVQSSPGQGTIVEVHLPLGKRPAQPAARVSSSLAEVTHP